MPRRFPVGPLETAWTRTVLCGVEIIDAMTLAPVTDGIKVRAAGLKNGPNVNHSGFHYWLLEGNAQPQRISVTSLDDIYSDVDTAPPVPPQKFVRIELAPRSGYPFPAGATAVRGTVNLNKTGPVKPVVDAAVRLQWSDGAIWVDAATQVMTDDRGQFAAPLRLAPKDEPRLITGGIAVRLTVRRGSISKTSNEFALPAGRVSTTPQPFIWNDLNP
jgi:hypothetical protein